MTKPWLFVLLAAALPMNPSVINSGQGTLFVIGSTSTSIVVAADGRVSDKGILIGATDKLMPLGNRSGVCFIGRYWLMSQKSDTVDLQKTIRDWIRANPTVALPDAHESMAEKLLGSIKSFRLRNPNWKPERNDPVSYFICVGYYMGLPKYYESRYEFAPGVDVTSTPKSFDLTNWRLVTQGWGKVCQEITNGTTPGQFSVLKNDPAVVKYRKAYAKHSFSSISTDDLLRLSRMCLEATESPEGGAFDPDAKFVGPPNRYCVIDERQGLRWVDPPHK